MKNIPAGLVCFSYHLSLLIDHLGCAIIEIPMRRSTVVHIIKDSLLIFCSIGVALFFLLTPVVEKLLTSTREIEWFVTFIAGIFFTSVLTVPAAIVVLGELGATMSPWTVAAIGALGAVCGDFILFRFIKSHFNRDIEEFVKHRRFRLLFSFTRLRSFRWLLPFLGGLIMASPLPDELGVTLLGVAKLPTKIFMVVSYVSNFIGILLVALIGRSLAF